MTLDATARQLGLRLIRQYGKAVTYVSVSEGAYDPATGSATPATNDFSVMALVKDPNGYQIKNGLCQVGDKLLTIAAYGLISQNCVVATTDKFTVDNETFTVVSIQKIYSGVDVVLYKMIGRKT